MDLTGKKVAVLVEDLYQDQEVWYPVYRLREAGATVLIAGTGSKNVYKSKHGYEITADSDAHKLDAAQVDGVIVPGGYAPDILRRYEAVNKFVREVSRQGKVVASICHGSWVLCSADVLRGKTSTCFFAIKDDVVNAGSKWVDQEVCVDGNLITSRKPDDLPAFMRAILQALAAGRPAVAR
ncbi:MAG: type 1 glutamine amidotransferase [Planctomycetes bacterium]|nr:type 1 glutamine amidotransferase [Planctomycetota bacterium]